MVRSRITGSKGICLHLKIKKKFLNWIIALQDFVVFCHTTRFSHMYAHVPSLLNLSPSHSSSLSQSPCLRVKFLTEMVRLPSKLFKEKIVSCLLSTSYILPGAERNAERMQRGLLPSRCLHLCCASNRS